MKDLLGVISRAAGYAGILACVIAFVLRLLGFFTIGSISVVAILQGGIALVVIGCFIALQGKAR